MAVEKLYIEVAVTIPTQTTFTYKVPEKLLLLVQVGKRVLVPFGRRRITGYITSVLPEDTTPEYKTRDIIEILDEIPLFSESHIPFFKWISNYYLYPFGEVIKSALPGGININDTTFAVITPKGQKALIKQKKLSQPEVSVLSGLNISEQSSGALIRNNENVSISTINALAKKELIELKRELKKNAVGQKTERFVKFTGHGISKTNLTEKRINIIDLLEEKEIISVRNLKDIIPTAAGFFKFLEAEGFIEFFEKKVYRDPFGDAITPDTAPTLMPEQSDVVETVSAKIGAGFSPFLLAGVTGSGKTEVYMRLIEETVKKGFSAIVLVPEIALISQTERRFRGRFGENIAVLHSGLSKGEKYDQWLRIANKEVTIVIGARSAIFAPVENIGIIIVDEEHDSSYKQENGLKYNGRDLAVVRAKLSDAIFLSGSATPSIQSWHNTTTGKFAELKLTKRVSDRPMPEIDIVDLKKFQDLPGIHSFITPPLELLMKETLEKKEQVLLFLNRRGYANYPLCATCGEPMKCINCDVSLTLHQGSNAYRCHMCGYMTAANSKCRTCNSSKIKNLGFGTERIEAAVKALFPDASVARMDQDTTTMKGSVVKILKGVKEKKTDVLIGTQMIAKGHDFPGITLVGIICADQSLNFPDFRACERTFQLLAQVAGRAGRGTKPGKVIMQTYNPEHFSILAAKKQNFFKFYDNEITFRESLGYPPYSRMVQIKISASDRNQAKQYASLTGDFLNNTILTNNSSFGSISILGPIEAAIPKMANRYRWQILLKSDIPSQLHKLSSLLVSETGKSLKKNDIRITVDVDPYYMM